MVGALALSLLAGGGIAVAPGITGTHGADASGHPSAATNGVPPGPPSWLNGTEPRGPPGWLVLP